MTITEFLEARIAEDEAVALPFRNQLGETRRWKCDEIGGAVRYVGPRPFGLPDLLAKFDIHGEGEHVARWDPARVLAECAAKRAMLAKIPKMSDTFDLLGGTSEYVLRCLAAVYVNHPDYRQEWAL